MSFDEQPDVDIHGECAAEIKRQRPYNGRAMSVQEHEEIVADLEREVAQWKNNHATVVAQARILKERTDMPIERVRAYENWQKVTAERDVLVLQNKALREVVAGFGITLSALRLAHQDRFHPSTITQIDEDFALMNTTLSKQ